MITSIIAFLVSLLLASFLTPLIRNLAIRKQWLDQVRSSRKVHSHPIPRLGGIAIASAFYSPLIGLLLVDSSVGRKFMANPHSVLAIFIGGVGIAVVGIVDDFRGMNATRKLSAQLIIAAIVYALGISVNKITTPWGGVSLGALALPFTLLWMVGVINAMNLIDGLDGLASGVAFVAVATNFVVATTSNNAIMMLIMAALGGSILGFLIYNFNPASIFMGDSGSMFLGFILASSSIITSSKSTATVAMLVPILALGLPIMDTLLSIGRRALQGHPLFSADKEHVHHRLLALGFSHRRTVIVLYGICIIFAGGALSLILTNGPQFALILCGTAVVVGIFIRKLGYFSILSQVSSREREKKLALREQVQEVGELIYQATIPAHAWQALQPLASSMGVAELDLTLTSFSNSGIREVSRFQWKIEESPNETGSTARIIHIRLPIEHEEIQLGELYVAWKDGRQEIPRADQVAWELLRDHLTVLAKRIFNQRIRPSVENRR